MTRGSSACKRIRILLGVFVLGGLRGQEESMVSTHLAGCALCRADYDDLAEVPALLDMLSAEEAQADERLDILVPRQKQPKRLR